MSTCPDTDLFSAYVDGEVPSPWKEKLEAHLSVCQDCSRTVSRYLRQKSLFAAVPGNMQTLDTDASFTKLMHRRLAVMARKQEQSLSSRGKFSVRLPLPAVAAALVLAFFIPQFINRGNQTVAALQNPGFTSNNRHEMRTVSTRRQVYSPDSLPVTGIPSDIIGENRLFTMVNFARQFATDKQLFEDADIIIIRLPALTDFSDTGNQFIKSENSVLRTAGYFK